MTTEDDPDRDSIDDGLPHSAASWWAGHQTRMELGYQICGPRAITSSHRGLTVTSSGMSLTKTMDDILSDLRFPTRTCPLTFTGDFFDTRGVRVGLPASEKSQRLPDVTAIILNWSRLDNVIRIASLLCGPWLDDTIAQVYIWNNSPKSLSKEVGN